MTTLTESFDKPNSPVLGPDLPWAKFPVPQSGGPTGFGPDDGQVLAHRFAVSGGNRSGLSPPIEAAAFARCDMEADATLPLSITATLAAFDLTENDPSSIYNYPELFIGVGIDATEPAGALSFGPSGLWVEVDPHWDVPGPAGAAYLVYGNYGPTGFTYGYSGGGSFTTFATPSPGDTLTLEAVPASPTTGAWTLKLNGVTLDAGSYDFSLMSNPIVFGGCAGIGIVSFWGPAGTNNLVAGADALDAVVIDGTGFIAVVEPPPPPPPPIRGTLRARLYDDHYSLIDDLPIVTESAQWEEQLSDAGSGSVDVVAYLPNGTPNPLRPVGDQFVQFVMADGLGGWVNAWALLVEDDEKTRVAATIGARRVKVNGRGPLAIYEDSQVYPTLGYAAFPQQIDMYYDWRHREFDAALGFDDTPWVGPQSFGALSLYQYLGGGTWGLPGAIWGQMPGGAVVHDPLLIGPPSGNLFIAPLGHWLLRHFVTLPHDGLYIMCAMCDNRATFYLDSVIIGTTKQGGDATTAGWLEDCEPFTFYATAGDHFLAVDCENIPRGDGLIYASNATGVAYTCFVAAYPLTSAYVVFSSSDTANIALREYPPEPPGMSPGKAVRLFVELAQAHGDLPLVDLSSFNDLVDSNGVSWGSPPRPTISTKVLTDGLTFLREVSGTYMDWRADRDNPFRLLLYKKDTMNAVASGESFLPGVNAVGMNIKRDYKVANVLIGVTQQGYVEVVDAASVALHGRRPRRFELGSVDNSFEAIRVMTAALGRYSNLRDEISATVDGPVGYLDYDLGQTAPTVDSDDAPVTERIMAIGVRQSSTGRGLTTPTLKDLFLA